MKVFLKEVLGIEAVNKEDMGCNFKRERRGPLGITKGYVFVYAYARNERSTGLTCAWTYLAFWTQLNKISRTNGERIRSKLVQAIPGTDILSFNS